MLRIQANVKHSPYNIRAETIKGRRVGRLPSAKMDKAAFKNRLCDIESDLRKQQEELHKLRELVKQLKQRLSFFEQLVFADYLSLLNKWKERIPAPESKDRLN